MNYTQLWGYKVFSSGSIYGKCGKKINKSKSIKVKWNNKDFRTISYARFIYYAFNQDTFNIDDKNTVITFKDGDSNNKAFNNLVAVSKKEILQGDNNANIKVTDSQVQDIIDKYNQNIQKDRDLNCPNKKVSYRTLAVEYGISHSMVAGIIKGQFRNKENYVMR